MYEIRPQRKRRMRTDFIILTHARNLFEKGSYMRPDILEGGTYHYTWGAWQHYYYRETRDRFLPMHYFTELLDEDYVIYVGNPRRAPSKFIDDLVAERLINYKYLNSILIAMGDDFSKVIPDDRMYTHLSEKLISNLLWDYGLDLQRVVYLDDILNPNWQKTLKESDLQYDIVESKYMNMDKFKFLFKKYKKD